MQVKQPKFDVHNQKSQSHHVSITVWTTVPSSTPLYLTCNLKTDRNHWWKSGCWRRFMISNLKHIEEVHSYFVCATSILAVGCPVWLWERCSRKESWGRPRTSVFRCSRCTCVGNSAWSRTVNLWYLTWCGERVQAQRNNKLAYVVFLKCNV